MHLQSGQFYNSFGQSSMATIKHYLAKNLVDCWYVVKKITLLNNYTFTRSFDIQEFIGNMTELEEFSKSIIAECKEKVLVLKSAPLSQDEKRRGYLQNGGTKPGFEFPYCVHCSHNLIDLPQQNASICKENKQLNNIYMSSCHQLNNIRMVFAAILQTMSMAKN